MQEADYIIVGAGSAGCILAERLSADGQTRVLLLEAGGGDTSPWVSIPLGYGLINSHPDMTWAYTAEPDSGLNGRTVSWPRGRLIGGSGSINAMVYCRGLPGDFDDWEAAGAEGWGWTSVKQVYEQLETKVTPSGRNGTGPIHVQTVSDQIHKVTRHFFDAAREVGLPVTGDMNGDLPEGAGAYTINTKGGYRCSSAKAFLDPARKRSNLVVRTRMQVKRILFDENCATGVELTTGEILGARREVILSAGAVNTPQLLQLSGVGPGALLQDNGIPVVLGNDNVGGNLQDHVAVNYTFKARETTLNAILRPLWGKAMAALQYALTRRGPLSLSVNQCGGFVRSSHLFDRPDQQLYFNPVSWKITPDGKRRRLKLDPFNGFIISAQPARPTSRGRIDIRSADAGVHPHIRPNSLATEDDIRSVIDGGRLCQRLMRSRALSELVETPVEPSLCRLDDKGLIDDFRERATTVFHPVSTCRIGVTPETSVVDSRLRVHGIDGLRVADASVFPNITSGNTNAPTMMVGLKASGIILEDRKSA